MNTICKTPLLRKMNLLAVAASAMFCTLTLPISAHAESQMLSVTGKLAYMERIAMPPDSMAQVKIGEISASGTLENILTEVSFSAQGIPAPFALAVNQGALDDEVSYGISAAFLNHGGTVMWTTPAIIPLDPHAEEVDLDIVFLTQVMNELPSGDEHAAGALESDSFSLTSGEWVVEDINGKGVIDHSRSSLNFSGDGRLSGRAGCNNHTGSYQAEKGRLETDHLAVTFRACLPALAHQERAFLDILTDARSFEFTPTGALVISDTQGRTITSRLQ